MSHTTWTGEELQAHLDAWSEQAKRGVWLTIPTPCAETVNGKIVRYWIEYEGVTVNLTQMQAEAIMQYRELGVRMTDIPRGTLSGKELQYLFAPHLPQPTRHDGYLDFKRDMHVQQCFNRVDIASLEDIEHGISLTIPQALSLLAWLKQEEPTLQQLAQEG